MYFDSFADFIAMGGHGIYVWMSYGVTILVLLANFIGVRRGLANRLAGIRLNAAADLAVSTSALEEQDKDYAS